jgi:uncharacterized membrane protein
MRVIPLAALTACSPVANQPLETPGGREGAPEARPVPKAAFNVPLRLVGRDPTWIGRVARDGLSIGGMAPGRVRVPWVDPVISAGTVRWRAETPQGTLDITLTPAACNDGTGQRYTFSATVVLAGATLQGCAAPETDFTWVE